jgi:hypothetical protein
MTYDELYKQELEKAGQWVISETLRQIFMWQDYSVEVSTDQYGYLRTKLIPPKYTL